MPTIEFWGCSSVDRALRSHRRGRGFESHQLHQFLSSRAKRAFKKSWGYGGMVDAEDLKSFDHCDRVGSSPTIPTTDFYRSEARILKIECPAVAFGEGGRKAPKVVFVIARSA